MEDDVLAVYPHVALLDLKWQLGVGCSGEEEITDFGDAVLDGARFF